MTTTVRPSGFKQPQRDPTTAAMLSIIPGLGQLYNGETRKGFLFMLVATMNLTLFLGMCFNQPVLEALWNFGISFHMKPNRMLVQVLKDAHMGSAVSIILLGFFISFIAYCIRDAYDHAALRRRRIYPDMVIELPEATSGAYIFHFAFIVALFILAFFFIIPLPPRAQITDIEFIQNQPPTQKHIVSKRRAEHASENAGKHENKPVVAPSPAPKAPSKSSAPSKPSPAPTPHPAQPTPHPTPQPVSRPSPTPTPTPSPHMAPSPTPRPMLAPSPVAAPSPTPTPHAAPRAMPSPMPSLAPSPMAHSGPGMAAPSPVARPTGMPSGLPSTAPSPMAISHGGAPGFAPMPKVGSSPNGGFFSAPAPIAASGGGGGGANGAPSPVPVAPAAGGGRSNASGGGASGAPAPTRAPGGHGGGGGSSGPALAVAPSVPRSGGSGGGGGGDNQRGNPDANANPNGRPSVAAQADVDFGPYMADLQRRIKRHWFPPKGNESKRVVVIFKVHTGGELSNLRLDHSSGVALADKAALDAVQNAAPFRPLPQGAPADVDIQFTFDYNVFGGGGRGVFRQF